MVATTGSSPSVTFEESDKVGSSAEVFRPAGSTIGQFSTNLYNSVGTQAGGNVAIFGSGYTNTLDEADAYVLTNNAYENFWLNKDGSLLTIETRQPITVADTIVYDMTGMQQNKQYRLDFKSSNMNMTAGLTAVLKDNYLNTLTPIDLTSPSSAYFTVTSATASQARNRFSIQFRVSGIVPVGITTTAKQKGSNDVVVGWQVGSESGVQHYEVDRSTDGVSFSSIGTVTATKNNGTAVNYSYNDGTQNASGTIYYRVKMLLQSGETKLSNIATVTIGSGAGSFTIYPNPVEGTQINLLMKNEATGRYGVRILNAIGQLIYEGKMDHIISNGTEEVNLPTKVSAGVYTLELVSPVGGVEEQKLIIQH